MFYIKRDGKFVELKTKKEIFQMFKLKSETKFRCLIERGILPSPIKEVLFEADKIVTDKKA